MHMETPPFSLKKPRLLPEQRLVIRVYPEPSGFRGVADVFEPGSETSQLWGAAGQPLLPDP